MSWKQGVENARAAAQQRPAVDVDAPVTTHPSAEQPSAPKTGFALAVEVWRAERTGTAPTATPAAEPPRPVGVPDPSQGLGSTGTAPTSGFAGSIREHFGRGGDW